MLKLIPRSLVCALSLAMFLIVDAHAQAGISTATLKGTISDQSGAVVGGATVTARSVDRGTRRSTQAGAEGSYQILLLQPGAYALSVEAVGFQTRVIRDVVLTVGQEVDFDVQMRVGEVANEISVNIDLPLIEIERTQQANTIDRRQILNLPNFSRSFTDYIFTLPGVASNSTAFSQNAARNVIAAPASGILDVSDGCDATSRRSIGEGSW
jgi:Carboxypeptidase regulatory-like domain